MASLLRHPISNIMSVTLQGDSVEWFRSTWVGWFRFGMLHQLRKLPKFKSTQPRSATYWITLGWGCCFHNNIMFMFLCCVPAEWSRSSRGTAPSPDLLANSFLDQPKGLLAGRLGSFVRNLSALSAAAQAFRFLFRLISSVGICLQLPGQLQGDGSAFATVTFCAIFLHNSCLYKKIG